MEVVPGSTPVTSKAPAIFGDMQDFVSPIDNKLVSGRRQFREHNRIHDVVPNADLKGLPTMKFSGNDTPDQQQARKNLKRDVIRAVEVHERR